MACIEASIFLPVWSSCVDPILLYRIDSVSSGGAFYASYKLPKVVLACEACQRTRLASGGDERYLPDSVGTNCSFSAVITADYPIRPFPSARSLVSRPSFVCLFGLANGRPRAPLVIFSNVASRVRYKKRFPCIRCVNVISCQFLTFSPNGHRFSPSIPLLFRALCRISSGGFPSGSLFIGDRFIAHPSVHPGYPPASE